VPDYQRTEVSDASGWLAEQRRQDQEEDRRRRELADREREAEQQQLAFTSAEMREATERREQTMTEAALEEAVRQRRSEEEQANRELAEWSRQNWQADLSQDERWLLERESGMRPDASNPTSTAYGLGQLLEANRRAYGERFGFDPDTSDPWEQKMMFRAYIQERYQEAGRARTFWEEHHWY